MIDIQHATNTMHPKYPQLKVGSRRCACTACDEYFRTPFAFEKHRIGRVGATERRCLGPAEMLARGWVRNAAGFWGTAKRPAGIGRIELGAAIVQPATSDAADEIAAPGASGEATGVIPAAPK